MPGFTYSITCLIMQRCTDLGILLERLVENESVTGGGWLKAYLEPDLPLHFTPIGEV